MIYNFVCAAFFATLVERLGRRYIFLVICTGMLMTDVIWTVLSAINQERRNFGDHGLAKGVLAIVFLYYPFYGMGLDGLSVLYLTEIPPYQLRAKQSPYVLFGCELFLIYNGFVNPIAMDAIDWKYYIVFCCICIIVTELAIVFFTFPETKSDTLETVAEVF